MVRALHHTPAHKERLISLGICPKGKIIYRATTLFHDPLLFEVEDALVALRRKDAQKIEVVLL